MVARETMINFIKQVHPEWKGLNAPGGFAEWDAVPDRNVAGVYYSLIGKLKTGRKAKASKQLELPLT